MIKRKTLPSLDRLNEKLSYDPDSGLFTWNFIADNPRFNGRFAGAVAGNTTPDGYIRIAVDGIEYWAHRLAFKMMTGQEPPEVVDHIDHDKGNNKWSNLRPATLRANQWNKTVAARSKTGIKGVYPRWNKFVAEIKDETGRIRALGCFRTIEEAAAARQAAERLVQGEFAYGARRRRKDAKVIKLAAEELFVFSTDRLQAAD